MFGRKRKSDGTDENSVEVKVPPGPRADGPWDSTEIDTEGKPYASFGSLHVPAREGMNLQLPTNNGTLVAVVVMAPDAALELRVFAASRSRAGWDTIREGLQAEAEKAGGKLTEVPGPFGPELRGDVPVRNTKGADQKTQRARMIGIDGPRWTLRATMLGSAAAGEPGDAELLEVLRGVVVTRGDEPRMVGEPLPLTMPPGAVRQPEAN